jgi:hypothetical protein
MGFTGYIGGRLRGLLGSSPGLTPRFGSHIGGAIGATSEFDFGGRSSASLVGEGVLGAASKLGRSLGQPQAPACTAMVGMLATPSLVTALPAEIAAPALTARAYLDTTDGLAAYNAVTLRKTAAILAPHQGTLFDMVEVARHVAPGAAEFPEAFARGRAAGVALVTHERAAALAQLARPGTTIEQAVQVANDFRVAVERIPTLSAGDLAYQRFVAGQMDVMAAQAIARAEVALAAKGIPPMAGGAPLSFLHPDQGGPVDLEPITDLVTLREYHAQAQLVDPTIVPARVEQDLHLFRAGDGSVWQFTSGEVFDNDLAPNFAARVLGEPYGTVSASVTWMRTTPTGVRVARDGVVTKLVPINRTIRRAPVPPEWLATRWSGALQDDVIRNQVIDWFLLDPGAVAHNMALVSHDAPAGFVDRLIRVNRGETAFTAGEYAVHHALAAVPDLPPFYKDLWERRLANQIPINLDNDAWERIIENVENLPDNVLETVAARRFDPHGTGFLADISDIDLRSQAGALHAQLKLRRSIVADAADLFRETVDPTWQRPFRVTINGVPLRLRYDSPKPGGQASGAVYMDQNGDRWMFKKQYSFGHGGSAYGNAEAEAAQNRIARRLGVESAEADVIVLDGRAGVVTRWYEGSDEGVDWSGLDGDQAHDLVDAWVIDMLTGNTDTHTGNVLTLDTGRVVKIDNGFAMRPPPLGRLDEAPRDPGRLYVTFWGRLTRQGYYANDSIVSGFDPNQVNALLDRLENLTDDEVDDLVRDGVTSWAEYNEYQGSTSDAADLAERLVELMQVRRFFVRDEVNRRFDQLKASNYPEFANWTPQPVRRPPGIPPTMSYDDATPDVQQTGPGFPQGGGGTTTPSSTPTTTPTPTPTPTPTTTPTPTIPQPPGAATAVGLQQHLGLAQDQEVNNVINALGAVSTSRLARVNRIRIAQDPGNHFEFDILHMRSAIGEPMTVRIVERGAEIKLVTTLQAQRVAALAGVPVLDQRLVFVWHRDQFGLVHDRILEARSTHLAGHPSRFAQLHPSPTPPSLAIPPDLTLLPDLPRAAQADIVRNHILDWFVGNDDVPAQNMARNGEGRLVMINRPHAFMWLDDNRDAGLFSNNGVMPGEDVFLGHSVPIGTPQWHGPPMARRGKGEFPIYEAFWDAVRNNRISGFNNDFRPAAENVLDRIAQLTDADIDHLVEQLADAAEAVQAAGATSTNVPDWINRSELKSILKSRRSRIRQVWDPFLDEVELRQHPSGQQALFAEQEPVHVVPV